MIVDLTSSDLWLAGEECTTCFGQIYRNSVSMTFQQTPVKKDIIYGNAAIQGFISSDTVTFVEKPSKKDVTNDVNFVLAFK